MTPDASAVAVPTAAALSVPRLVARAAAWLFLVALLTGLYVAAAMTGKLPVDPHSALAAHLGALMGSFLLAGFGWSLPHLRYGEVGQRRLAWGFIVPAFGNWLLTAVKAAVHVEGIDLTGVVANDAIFVLLNLVVVIPILIAAGAWVYGLHGEPSGR